MLKLNLQYFASSAKNMLIKVSTDGTVFSTVNDLNEASMSMEGDNQDISTIGAAYIKRIQGLKDASYELSGFYSTLTADNQIKIRDAWLNDTALHVQFLPDGTTGFKQEVKVASFEVSGAADGVVEVSIELEGTGTITTV